MISIVVPIHNEEELIERLHQEVCAAMGRTEEAWEVVYVDDGSRDRSPELLRAIAERDQRASVVELSRNWGHQAAVTAGLSVAGGDAVVLMDGDLQDPPAVIPDMIAEWRAGAEVVVATRRSRAERGLRGRLFPLFYTVLGWLSDFPIPLSAGIFGLLDRRAVDAIIGLSETNRYLPGLRAWVGYKSAVVYYDRAQRAGGEPKQTLLKLIKYALDAIFSFSYKPLRLSLALGLVFSSAAIVLGMAYVAMWMLGTELTGQPLMPGSATIIAAILLLGGVQLIATGILGEYIGRIYDEVKRRPLFIISDVHRSADVIPAENAFSPSDSASRHLHPVRVGLEKSA